MTDSPFWYACEEPERPPDAYVLWHYALDGTEPCRGCLVKIGVQAHRYPGDGHVAWVLAMIAGPLPPAEMSHL